MREANKKLIYKYFTNSQTYFGDRDNKPECKLDTKNVYHKLEYAILTRFHNIIINCGVQIDPECKPTSKILAQNFE